MRLTVLLVALFGLCVCLSLAEESMIEDDASESFDARNAIFGKSKPKPKSAAGRSKSTKATSKATGKATLSPNRATKSASQVTTQSKVTSVTGLKTTSLVATTSSSSTRRSSLMSSSSSVARTSSSPLFASSLRTFTSISSISNAVSTTPVSHPSSGIVSPTSSITSASTTNTQHCTPTTSKKNLLKTTICICPEGIKASASKTPSPPCPYTTVPPLSAMLPMQNTDENSDGGFWSKAWEVAKPHAGHVAGQAGQFAVDRYGQPIKDKFNHLIPVNGEDVSAADLAQVDPVQMEQAEESRAAQGAAEVDPSAYEGEQSEVDDGQAGVVQGGASVDGKAGHVGDGSGVDGTATQRDSQDAGRAGQGNGSPSGKAGQNVMMDNGNHQKGGASQQSGRTMDNDGDDSLNGVSDQGNPSTAAVIQAGNGGSQGMQNNAVPPGSAQSGAAHKDVAQDAGSDDNNNFPSPAPHNQPASHIRPKRVASSKAVSPALNWNGTSTDAGGASPSGSAPSNPLGNATTSGADGDEGPACPVHGDVSPDEMQGDDDPDIALPVGTLSECKQKRDVLRLRAVSICSPTVISSGSTFTSTFVCNEDVVTARDEVCDSSNSTAASGGSFATGNAASSPEGSPFFPNDTATSDSIIKSTNAGSAANLSARNPKPRDGGPFIVDKTYAGSGSNSSIRSRMAASAYSSNGTGSPLPNISIDGPACSEPLSSNISVSYPSQAAGNNFSTDSVTGIINSSVLPLRKGPIGPISARTELGSDIESHIRSLVSPGASSALSQDGSSAEKGSHSVHLGSAVLGQRWAHEFADVSSTTQIAGAEETRSASFEQDATSGGKDAVGTDEGDQDIEERDYPEEDSDMDHSSPPVKLDQNYKLRNSSTDTHAISEDDVTASSNPLPHTTVGATSKSNTNGETSEPYAPPLKSPTASLPPTTSPIQVSTVTVTADPWVWTTTLGQNGDEEINGTVIACEATVGMNIPITDAPKCVTTGDARWAILSTPSPTPYVYVKAPVDSSAYVGNLTATALSSALYSALSVACPEEECQPKATIPGIVYPGSHGDMKEGELVVTIHDGHLYTKDGGVRNLTFTLAAMLANASSTEMCFEHSKGHWN
ncbi:hypothetical protein KC343_g3214 [Hortaea werneckii]|nr:hypothetical protein KC352_g17416 [Hortaea werneckii]KAI7562084.1 hypothetical protein KC317_g8647 [Hortaea werneckii]KAI7622371.1 hypothetical protein KC346_g3245 [Hortaea werneckii]KAI7632906.1 hypothetical protein KC343_g3214 [Hortaea werneckii]KAI7668965.1 hypothetical protein KC319_g6251 [Hortaea werneckii]